MAERSCTHVSKPSRYTEGAIVRIRLENFMTYSSVEFSPGPHLNVVAAPNGTGKSTLVNGICLGLAGKTKWLGRATQATEFIKHGCDKATTEIELYNSRGENYVIRREIHRSGNANNTWTVNGRPGTQKAVEETVARLNIQVGNLCQFLPQDKVADFAKMTSVELLENTEKAVGSAELLENHMTLKSSRGRARDLQTQFKTLSDRLETEKAKNARLEQDVRNYEERQKHLYQICLLGKKRAWIAYEEKRKMYIEERNKKKQVQTQLNQKKRESQPLEAKLNSAQSKMKEYEGRMGKVTEVLRKDAESAASNNKRIDVLTEKIAEINFDLESRREEEAKRQRKVQELKKQVASLQNELAMLDTSEDVQPEIDAVNKEKYQLTQEKAQHAQASESLRIEINGLEREHSGAVTGLQRLNNVNNQKLDLLRSKHKATYDAVMWLRENKDRFKRPIHEPIMTQIHVKDQQYAKYVESSISFNDMKLFVCEDSDDVRLLMRLVRDEQKLPINVARMPSEELNDFRPRAPISELRRYGFHTYVRDLFECSDAVMKYLCKQYHLHNMPVGDNRTKEMIEVITRERPELTSFYSENDRHTITRSRYSNNIITSRNQLRQPTLLTLSVDTTRQSELFRSVRRCEEEINVKRTKRNDLQALLHQCDVKINDCNNRKRDLQKKRDERASFTQHISVKLGNIKRLEDDARDIQVEETRALRLKQDINIEKCGLLEEMKELTRKCADHSMGKVRSSLCYTVALHAESGIMEQYREQMNTIQLLERQLREVTDQAFANKDEAMRLLLVAEQGTDSAGCDLSPEFKALFSELPNFLEEIDTIIHHEQARADCIFQTDENILKEYHDRKKDIDRLEAEYDTIKNKLQNFESEIDEIKKSWLERLRALLSRINENFSYFFKALKCAGEVDLEVPENPEDYEKYGIQIKVKFRDSESLRVLSPHSQSGGEKSVATVLYMMSMQELTRCPFRVVDEINQGMDAHNERKVYEMVLKTACERNTSQYFLLTPKLLPDLEYSENMTVLCIFNGPNMVAHTDWNLRKFLKRKRRFEA